MKYFKTAFHLLKFNIKSSILFEAIYKLFAWAVFSPVLYKLLDLAMRLSGSTYLTNDNMKHFFLTPTTDLVMLLIFILMSFYTLVDMSAMIFCFSISHQLADAGIFAVGHSHDQHFPDFRLCFQH